MTRFFPLALFVGLGLALVIAVTAQAGLRPDPAPGAKGKVTVLAGTYFCGVGLRAPTRCVFISQSALDRLVARLP